MKKQIIIFFLGLIILNNNSLTGQNDSITENQAKKDSIIKEELRQNEQLKIDLLKQREELQEIQLKQQQEAQDKQQKIIYVIISIFILLTALFIGLIRRNQKLKKLLKEEQEKTMELEK